MGFTVEPVRHSCGVEQSSGWLRKEIDLQPDYAGQIESIMPTPLLLLSKGSSLMPAPVF